MNDVSENMIDVTETLKNDLSAALYTYLTGLHSQLENKTSTETANDVVLSVLSLNIGHILGQLDPTVRNQNLAIVDSIIKDQITEVSKLADIQTYGMIGHG
jgi:hypothetical protein